MTIKEKIDIWKKGGATNIKKVVYYRDANDCLIKGGEFDADDDSYVLNQDLGEWWRVQGEMPSHARGFKTELSLEEKEGELKSKGVKDIEKVLCWWNDDGQICYNLEDERDYGSYTPSEEGKEFFALRYFNRTGHSLYYLHENKAEAYGLGEKSRDHSAYMSRGDLSRDSVDFIYAELEELGECLEFIKVEYKDAKGETQSEVIKRSEYESFKKSHTVISRRGLDNRRETRKARDHLSKAVSLIVDTSGTPIKLFEALEHAFRAGRHANTSEKWDMLQEVNKHADTVRSRKENFAKKGQKVKNRDKWKEVAKEIIRDDMEASYDYYRKELEERGWFMSSNQKGKTKVKYVSSHMAKSTITKEFSKIRKIFKNSS